MANPSMMADGGVDARLNSMVGRDADYIPPQSRKTHDASVTFEEYHFYAQQARREEAMVAMNDKVEPGSKGIVSTLFPSKKGHADTHPEGEKPPAYDGTATDRMHVTDQEWINASRALRLATWPAMFYLITTDILGPFTLPFAMATTGWGPGIALYTVFGALAGYSGYLMWHMFLGLDSYQYPLKTYGDLAFRIYGPWARYGVNALQSIQLLCNVGVIVIQNGQSLSQVAKFKLCFAICCLVFAIAGFLIGQIRTLAKFGWIANMAIWLNLLIIFITMGVVAHSEPNYAGAQAASAGAVIDPSGALVAQLPDGSYPPVRTSGALPDPGNFGSAVNGLMQAVYSYGGAMLFVEFMSEMRRPYDFIKAMWGAQAFIYLFYMFYGCFIYGYQGQYTINPAYQSLSPYNWTVVSNVLAMITALIAAGLYGNIGIKVLYNNVFVDLFNSPPLTSKKGKYLWAAIVPVYWTVAFIIAASIPNFSGLTGVVAAFCILHFTYTFPPLFFIGYIVQRGALRYLGIAPETNHSSPKRVNSQPTIGGAAAHNDSGSDSKDEKSAVTGGATASGHEIFRSARTSKAEWSAAIKKSIIKNLPNLTWLTIYTLGAIVTSGLGAWASIEVLIAAFKNPTTTSFTCHSPLDG